MISINTAERWKKVRLSSLFYENVSKNTDFAEQKAFQFYFGTIVPKKEYELTEELIETYKKYTLIEPGDIMINGLNLNYDFVTQRVGLVQERGIITSAYLSLRPRRDINTRYYAYLLKAVDAQKLFHGLGTGIRLTLSFKEIKNLQLPVPPNSEQDQIVKFLDWKMSSINRHVSTKRKQITLLHEILAVYISEVVTNGLNENNHTRDSHVEWIGNIPEHWNTIRCKYLFTERDERSAEGLEQHLSMSQKYGLVPDSQLDERRMLSESYKGGKLCYENDLVLNRLKAHLGVFSLSPQFGVISPDYTVLVPNTDRIIPAFAETVLKNERCRRELRIRVRGIIEGFWRLYTDDFNTIVLPVPPIEEQREIMEHISTFKENIKKYEKILKQEIEALQELKTRIIADAVTGKIDTRSVEIPEYEYVTDEADNSIKDNELNETDQEE